MKLVEDKILKEATVIGGSTVKVDAFLNHQIDVDFINECGKEWYERFKDDGVTKILTIEASGIGIACLAAQQFGVPVVFAKKSRSANMGKSLYSTRVVSYTHGLVYDVNVSKDRISKGDRILIIDDLLANGSALKALIKIAEMAGATVVGAGVIIEKSFQKGGAELRDEGYRIESLAKIKSLESSKIEFED